jgi:GNAT superfamily N-acetyltransferase
MTTKTTPAALKIRPATAADAPLLVQLITELAEYEKLRHEVTATPEGIRQTLFGPRPFAEALIAEWNDEPAGFALFFHNYSTFLARPGIYLEDLFVRTHLRGHKIGLYMLKELAAIAQGRGCPRLDWQVLDWNKPAIDFYDRLGATARRDWLSYRMTGEPLARLSES